MLMVLSPAKSLDFATPVPVETHSQPRFPKEAQALVGLLRRRSPDELAQLMGISDALARLNFNRYAEWSPPFAPHNAKQAVLAFDGDARGGAALSVRHITGKPIKFAGVGEKLGGIEVFHPERMASRILGMGDVLSLIEDARKGIDEEKAIEFARKLKSGKTFDLSDFKEQIGQMRKMGGLSSMIEKLPAQFSQAAGQLPAGGEEKAVARIEGIINSMTPAERSRPELLKAARKRRIALGAGVQVQEVNRLLKQFEQTQKMMKQFGGGKKGRGGMGGMFGGGKFPGMGGRFF
jgi:signal recognition particle subunit SRP54